jgi:hypothetical protein
VSAGGFEGSPLGVLAVIWNPVGTLRRVAEERRALAGFVVVAVSAALGLVTNLVFVLSGLTRRQLEEPFSQQPGIPPGFVDNFVRIFEISVLISALISPLLGWLIVSVFMQLVTRFFAGEGPLSAMLGVVGVAQVVTLVGFPISVSLSTVQYALDPRSTAGTLVGLLAGLVGVAFFFWYVVLVVIGAAQARNIGYGESAGSCAISCVGIGAILLVVGVVVGVGIAVSVGAASQ